MSKASLDKNWEKLNKNPDYYERCYLAKDYLSELGDKDSANQLFAQAVEDAETLKDNTTDYLCAIVDIARFMSDDDFDIPGGKKLVEKVIDSNDYHALEQVINLYYDIGASEDEIKSVRERMLSNEAINNLEDHYSKTVKIIDVVHNSAHEYGFDWEQDYLKQAESFANDKEDFYSLLQFYFWSKGDYEPYSNKYSEYLEKYIKLIDDAAEYDQLACLVLDESTQEAIGFWEKAIEIETDEDCIQNYKDSIKDYSDS